jgi:hypothetical protein
MEPSDDCTLWPTSPIDTPNVTYPVIDGPITQNSNGFRQIEDGTSQSMPDGGHIVVLVLVCLERKCQEFSFKSRQLDEGE